MASMRIILIKRNRDFEKRILKRKRIYLIIWNRNYKKGIKRKGINSTIRNRNFKKKNTRKIIYLKIRNR